MNLYKKKISMNEREEVEEGR